jgi:hypothetical protein
VSQIQKQPRYKYTGKYETVYKPEMCERVMQMARQDKLRTQAMICLELGISFTTWDKWIDPMMTDFKPDFFEAVYMALTYMRAKWEEHGIARLSESQGDDKFNDRLYMKFMERYHGYHTKNDTRIIASLSETDSNNADELVEKMWKEF